MLPMQEITEWLGDARTEGLLVGALDRGDLAIRVQLVPEESVDTIRRLNQTAPANWYPDYRLGLRSYPEDFGGVDILDFCAR
jgi:hypothetical protein